MPNVQDEVKKGQALPKPWCLQGYDDVKAAIDHVASIHRDQPIMALGLSTGAAQLRHYVNFTGKDCKLSGAILCDGGADWLEGFKSIDRRCPGLSYVLKMAAEGALLNCGRKAEKVPQEISNHTVRNGLMEYVANTMAPAHGSERSIKGATEYALACNPENYSDKLAVPILEMLTMSDMLLAPEAAQQVYDYHLLSENCIVVLTRYGTHMVRWQGWSPSCWYCKAGSEFLDAVLENQSGEPRSRLPSVESRSRVPSVTECAEGEATAASTTVASGNDGKETVRKRK
jgi:predicted alpha/beta-fold hydrolase